MLAHIREPERQRQTHVPAPNDPDLDALSSKELRLSLDGHAASSFVFVLTIPTEESGNGTLDRQL
jgi:hypothetical protein